ncbi:MAG: cysteine desulfurase NifS [Hyphomonadaceae bacterium]|nr:cysteine desulfurase NifS [Clostridia bacterium]
MNNKLIYMDHAATTAMKPEVLEAMMPYFTLIYGNPSRIYRLGRKNKQAVEDARQQIATALGAEAKEIFITGSGTEADNWAIKGVAYANQKKGNHIITTSIEHHAVLHTVEYLAKNGFTVTYLPVDGDGLISLDDLEKAITDQTILITVMFANNEIGTIQPIREIGAIAKKHGVYFHTDAVQAVGNVPIDVNDLHIDLLSLSGHKFEGPKGIGALYVRKGVKLQNFVMGGGQERGKRAGTENVASIVGLAKALAMATQNISVHTTKIQAMRDAMMAEIEQKIPYIKLNGHRTMRLCNNVNYSFQYIEGESLLLMLDMQGIAASSGSACTSGSLDPSHVLLAIGLPHEIAHGSLRLTLGEDNSMEDVTVVVDKLKTIVARLREMSPLYEEIKNV